MIPTDLTPADALQLLGAFEHRLAQMTSAQRRDLERALAALRPAVARDADHARALAQTRQERDDALAELAEARRELAALRVAEPDGEALDLSDEVERLEAELRAAREELRALREDIRNDPQVQEVRRRVEALEKRVHRPHFWTASFAATFAESVAVMQDAHAPLVERSEEAGSVDAVAVFRTWQAEVVAAVELARDGAFDLDLGEHARRLLVCQWVYLRWLELTSDLRAGA